MTEFLLNDKEIRTDAPKGMILLDFIRQQKKLKGTKSACREGDCGSCTVLIGKIETEQVNYKAITSCITPLGNVHGKHVLTIEGLNIDKVTSIQQALIDTAAVQCGYCTPGIVVSLTDYVLSNTEYQFDVAKDAVGGNICRCTGYKSIERAIEQIISGLKIKNGSNHLDWLISNNYVPAYLKDVYCKLAVIKKQTIDFSAKQVIGGGTDLYVQRPDEMMETEPRLVSDDSLLTKINIEGNKCTIGAACKISDLMDHEILCNKIPGLKKTLSLVASKLIRNIATVGGNLVNASPIGDLSILFLALNASVEIKSEETKIRSVKLYDFFKSYKNIDLTVGEILTALSFELPSANFQFNFEKVSKRKYLDIASVNSALSLEVEDNIINTAHLSVGGVSAVPLYLSKTCKVLTDEQLNHELLQKAAVIFDSEISPISDVRGSANYKRLLARQLFFAHFIELFPEKFELEKLVTSINH